MKILFLCTGNSCRSQMAEGWARHLSSGLVEVYSAGTSPTALNSEAVRVMAEVGVDISQHTSKHLRKFLDPPPDLVVTVCDNAQETCPRFPGSTRTIHHGFDDPPKLAANAKSEEEALRHYRRVRDEIREFVITLPGIIEKTSG